MHISAEPSSYPARLGLLTTGRTRHEFSVSRRELADLLLHIAFFVAMYRATGMWFGYPSTQNENASIDPAVMQALLYSLIPLTLAVAALIPKTVLQLVRHTPRLILAFAALVLIATLLSQNVTASVRGLVAVVVISAPVLIFRLKFGPERTMIALRRFAAAAVVINLFYILAFPGYGIMGGSLAGSARGMFVHKNLFGQFSAVAFLLLLPFPLTRPVLRYSTIFYGGAALLALACVVLSLSSTALALAMVGLMMMIFTSMASHVPSAAVRAYVFLLVAVFITTAAYGLGSLLVESFASGVGKDTTFSGRTEVWEALMRAVYERPIFGHGFALFRQPDYIAIYTSQIPWGPRSTHNSYLEIVLNIGVPAALIWIFFLLSRLVAKFVTRSVSTKQRNLRIREVGVISAIAVGAFTEAGIMLAPLITWVILISVLPTSGEP
jgi:O-antigen ligase